MTHFRNTPKAATTPVNADSLLRDIAFVLRMTRKVKSDMITDRATNATTEPEVYTRPEPNTCAV